MTLDMHKDMKETVLYYDNKGELVKMSGYQKVIQKIKNLIR